jgi:hypothetical protein
MKVDVMCDELYPYYEVGVNLRWNDGAIEVDRDTLRRWSNAMKLFAAVQEEMAEYYEEQVLRKRAFDNQRAP